MRNLDLSGYDLEIPDRQTGEIRTVHYQVRDSVVNLLFNAELHLGSIQLLKQDDLARKILDAPDSFVLLEEAEYQAVKLATEAFHGFERSDVQFVRRILECPEVQVQVVPSQKEGE